jgi:hypothetical protein
MPDQVTAIGGTGALAAAVSGRATRVLGVRQGSAAQQAAEMVPHGVRVVAALHTVNGVNARYRTHTSVELTGLTERPW